MANKSIKTRLTAAALIICSAAIAEDYNGGTTDGSSKYGDITNVLNGGTYNTYYGGNVNTVSAGSPSGDVYGNITNELTGVTITGNFIGANWTNDSSGKPLRYRWRQRESHKYF